MCVCVCVCEQVRATPRFSGSRDFVKLYGKALASCFERSPLSQSGPDRTNLRTLLQLGSFKI